VERWGADEGLSSIVTKKRVPFLRLLEPGSCMLSPSPHNPISPGPPPSEEQVDLASRLLQALRWRLVRSSAGIARYGVLATWIEVDLMGCYGGEEGAVLPVSAFRREGLREWREGGRREKEGAFERNLTLM
jgi:hypothetical protein